MLRHLSTGLVTFLILASGALAEDLLFKVDPNLKLSGRIAFTAEVRRESHIFVLDLDTRRVRPFGHSDMTGSYPAWSPDGTRLVFSSEKDGTRAIFVANWQGGEISRLTNGDESSDHPSWSPDGSKILYYSGSNLFSVPASGGAPSKITKFTGQNTTPSFSTDGTKISYSTNRFWPGWDVCLFDLGSKSERCILQGSLNFCRAVWSPKGDELAYSTGSGGEIDLEIMKLETGGRTQLTKLTGREYDATWSPAGDQIAFVAEDGQKDIFNLYVVTPTTKLVKKIVESPLSIRYLSWSGVTTLQLESKRLATQQQEEDGSDY